MKQTKPYGQPCTSVQLSINYEDKSTKVKRPTLSKEVDVERKENQKGYPGDLAIKDLFFEDVSNSELPRPTDYKINKGKSRKKARVIPTIAVISIVIPFIFIALFFLRDGMRADKILISMSESNGAMHCEEGKIIYPKLDLIDLIKEGGSFICTKWVTQKRFTSLPRGPNFRE